MRPQQTMELLSQKIVPVITSSAQDRLWITQTLAGDPRAFGFLMNKYKNPLFDLTCRVLKNRSEGEDILQDAFIQAYRHLKNFRNDSKFSTWMYTIVMNRLRNHLRKNKIIRWSSLDAPRMGSDDLYPEFPHLEPPIDTVMERKLDLDVIQRAVGGFPLRYQSIFIMHYFQNLSVQEIADRIGRPLGTVKVYLHRSRQMLYKNLKKRTKAIIPGIEGFGWKTLVLSTQTA